MPSRQTPWRDTLVGLVLLPIAGVLAALGQAPWSLWWVALIGWALGLAVIARSPAPTLAAWAMGVVHFAVALHWLTEPFQVDAAATGWLAIPAIAGAAGGLSIFWAVGAFFGVRLGGPVGIAVGVAVGELARSWLFTGFPWALPGHVLIDSAALPAASWGGAHLLGLFVLVGAGAVATLRLTGLVCGVMLWAAPFGIAATLPPAPHIAPDAAVIRLIQPNAPQHLKWDPDWVGIFWRRALELTAAEGDVDAVLWPETTLPSLLENSEDLRPMIARAATVPAILGVQRYDDHGHPRNGAVLLDRQGDVTALYDKHRLVPFGEYLPLPGLFRAIGIGPLAAQMAGTYAPGDGPALFELPGIGPVQPLICYEAIFPQDLHRVPRPRVILHLTNDAWFGDGAGPQQHLALARLRAAEHGLPVLRAANTGISASIDARGAVLAALPLNEAGKLDVALPSALPSTPYAKTGDLTALLLLLALATALFARRPSEMG
ncbi:apolipoprotein N-acyltransferase [Jannaschia aquimarina]|nr:apolipoprotein N-acyltransferase [Jannaschia aquimarina]